MPHHTAEHAKEKTKTQKQQLKQIDCGSECGFLIRSHDEKEIIDITKKHVKHFHGTDMSDEEVRNDMEDVKG